MVRLLLITFILFCSSLCFSQQSDKQDKDLATNTVKNVTNSSSEEKIKPSFRDESIGTKPIDPSVSGLPEVTLPYNPEPSGKESTKSKNTSIPR